MKNIFEIFWESILVLALIVGCASSCTKSPLEKSLSLAGDNRAELERVIQHYSTNKEDSLKLRATIFLIENMVYHYSYADTLKMSSYYQELDSMFLVYKDSLSHKRDSIYLVMSKQYPQNVEWIRDIHFVRGDYLISNIDQAVEAWQKADWARHVDFNSFCEYILPYKVMEFQHLDNWRDSLTYFCDGYLRDIKYCEQYRHSAYAACEAVNDALQNKIRVQLNIASADNSPKRIKNLLEIPLGSCDDYNFMALAVMRAKGIPCAIDFTPQWPFRSMGHSWCVLLENSGKHVVFEGASGKPASPHKEDHKMAKAFRKTFVMSDIIKDIYKTEKYVPSEFDFGLIKDVTEEYMVTEDIEVDMPKSSDAHYAYLSVFDNQNWKPVHWGKIEGKKARFDKMGKDIVYLPVLYDNSGIKPFADPILLSIKGEIVPLKADTTQTRELILHRKYPPMEGIYATGYRVINGKFQASDDPLFINSTTIDVHTITERAVVSKQILLDSLNIERRYWRYCSPDGAYCNMAEIYFYEKDSLNETLGKVIGTKGSWRPIEEKHTREAVFDRDVLTFFDAPVSDGAWVGMDFDRPVAIRQIDYLGRNDGNCIEIGDEYELMYWANNSWQSLGKQVANNIELRYHNCPFNALFLLRNHTKGKEERIFTYENGEQVWW